MAIKKIEIRPKGDGTYPDVLYPKTSADMVFANDGLTVEQKLVNVGTANGISVVDSTGVYTATNVESALKEVMDKANSAFTSANNGKTDIASVVGSPATSGDTFTQLKTHIQTSKNDLATNLTAKGQTSTGTETLDALVDKVALVSSSPVKAIHRGTIILTNDSNPNVDIVNDITIPAVDMTRCFITYDLSTDGSNMQVSYTGVHLYFFNSTTLRAIRHSTSGLLNGTMYMNYTVVEYNPGVVVHRGLTYTSQVNTTITIPTTNLSKYFIKATPIGYSNTSISLNDGTNYLSRTSLNSATQLAITRNNTFAISLQHSWQVVSFT